jgi:urea transporter
LQQLIKVLDINLRGLGCNGVIFHAYKLLGLCVSCDLVFDVLQVSVVLNDVFLASFGDDLRVYRLYKRRVF